MRMYSAIEGRIESSQKGSTKRFRRSVSMPSMLCQKALSCTLLPCAGFREGDSMNFRKVLIGVDDSPISAYAAQVGIGLAHALNAEVALIHVFDTPAPDPDMPEDEHALALAAERAGTQLLADIRARVPAGMETALFTPQGEPGEEIVTAAKDWGA